MFKKILVIGVALIMCVGLFTGCNNSIKITDFDGLEDLPRSPSRVVFATDFGEGLQSEIDIPSEDMSNIMDKLFARTYKKMSKYINIDVLNETLKIYDSEGKQLTVPIGVIHDNGRWHEPSQDDLRTILYEIANINK